MASSNMSANQPPNAGNINMASSNMSANQPPNAGNPPPNAGNAASEQPPGIPEAHQPIIHILDCDDFYTRVEERDMFFSRAKLQVRGPEADRALDQLVFMLRQEQLAMPAQVPHIVTIGTTAALIHPSPSREISNALRSNQSYFQRKFSDAIGRSWRIDQVHLADLSRPGNMLHPELCRAMDDAKSNGSRVFKIRANLETRAPNPILRYEHGSTQEARMLRGDTVQQDILEYFRFEICFLFFFWKTTKYQCAKKDKMQIPLWMETIVPSEWP